MTDQKKVTVTLTIHAPLNMVWLAWTSPEDIKRWNIPSGDWRSPIVENNVCDGGKFFYRMEKTDGTGGFDFTGTYGQVVKHKLISYTLNDGRGTVNEFAAVKQSTVITETFDTAPEPSVAEQEAFCAGVLNTFKQYVEDLLLNVTALDAVVMMLS